MQILPPTVAVFQILKDARALVDQWRGHPIERAGKTVELRHRAGGGDGQIGRADRKGRPFEIGKIDQPGEVDLRFGE
jgi:hypothetical protein